MSVTLELRPVPRQTLAKVVMQRLLEFIEAANLQTGEPLPSQHELARRLGVSRPVLREAMQGLASVGVIDIRPGSGCYVGDPRGTADPESIFEVLTHESALETLEARLVLEVELAGLAAQRATADDFEAMTAILRRLKRAIARGSETSAVTSDFHTALAKAGQNAVLFKMAQFLRRPRRAQGLRIEQALPDITAGEYESHFALFEAVRTGDADWARAAMREHLERAHGWEERVAAARKLAAS